MEHRVQRQISSLPNVLLLRVERGLGIDGEVVRVPVAVEQHLTLRALGENLTLGGALFHVGSAGGVGKYMAAGLGARGDYWLFDNEREPQCLGADLAGVYPKHVCFAVFVRQGGGADFAGARIRQEVPREAEGRREAPRNTQSAQRVGRSGGVHSLASGVDVGRESTNSTTTAATVGQDVKVLARLGRSLFPVSAGMHRTFEAAFFERLVAARRAVAEVCCRRLVEAVLRGSGLGELVSSRVQVSIERALRGEEVPGPVDDFAAFVRFCLTTKFSREELFKLRLPEEAKDAGPDVVSRGGLSAEQRAVAKARARVEKKVALAAKQRVERKEAFDRFFAGAAAAESSAGDSVHSGKRALVSSGGAAGERSAGDISYAGQRGLVASSSTQAVRGCDESSKRRRCGAQVRSSSGASAPGPALHTALRGKLCGLQVPEEVADAVLGEMQVKFGEGLAWEYAQADWLMSWPRWDVFAEDVRVGLRSWESGFAVMHVAPLVSNVIFALFRFAMQGERIVVEQTDEGMLANLRAAGWERRVGKVWGENDCLADSLLQLLIERGIVERDVDRELACHACRQHLENSEGLMPRALDGSACSGEMLEHYRHTAPVVKFFLQFFGLSADVLPRAGITLVVHARYDGAVRPPDSDIYCANVGSGAGAPWEFHLFNWTGDGGSGYHYDPLVRSPVVRAESVHDSSDLSDTEAFEAPGVEELDGAGLDLSGLRSGAFVDDMENLRRRVLRWQISVDPPEPSSAVQALASKVFSRTGDTSGERARDSAAASEEVAASAVAGVARAGASEFAAFAGDMLFDARGVAQGLCRARVWNGKCLTEPVFRQCAKAATRGEFCGGHREERRRPQGIWDPPEHASLPQVQRAKGEAEARKRRPGAAVAAAVSVEQRRDVVEAPAPKPNARAPAQEVSLHQAGEEGVGSSGGAAPGLSGARSADIAGRGGSLLRRRAGERRGVIVSGFGDERVDDVAADEARRIAEGARRGDERRREGDRGRMVDRSGNDLDRGAGGAWHAGRR